MKKILLINTLIIPLILFTLFSCNKSADSKTVHQQDTAEIIKVQSAQSESDTEQSAIPMADYPPKGWTDSITEAIAQAEKENKMLLLDFTGSDWCVWCRKLNAEVFSTQEFKDWSAQHLVKVFIDSPRNIPLSKEVQMQNQILQQVFGVEGFPTVWLLDSNLVPLLKTGYREGGASEYIRHLSNDRVSFPKETTENFPAEFRKIVTEYIGPIPD